MSAGSGEERGTSVWETCQIRTCRRPARWARHEGQGDVVVVCDEHREAFGEREGDPWRAVGDDAQDAPAMSDEELGEAEGGGDVDYLVARDDTGLRWRHTRRDDDQDQDRA